MSATVENILEEVGTLPKEERRLLICRIYSQYGFPVDPEVQAQWDDVVDQRWEKAKADPSLWLSASETFDSIKKEYGF